MRHLNQHREISRSVTQRLASQGHTSFSHSIRSPLRLRTHRRFRGYICEAADIVSCASARKSATGGQLPKYCSRGGSVVFREPARERRTVTDPKQLQLQELASELVAMAGLTAPHLKCTVIVHEGMGYDAEVCVATSLSSSSQMRGVLANVITESVMREGHGLGDVAAIASDDLQRLWTGRGKGEA